MNNKKIIAILIFVAGLAMGVAGFYLFQTEKNLSVREAGAVAINFVNKSIEKDNLTASLLNIAEESGLYKFRLKIADQEYDSFISKDGKYLFSFGFNLEEQDSPEEATNETEQGASFDDNSLSNLANCLTEKGAKFYGAFWCSHCKNQKEMFGKAAEFLPYVECSTPDGNSQTAVCRENNITGYPTWVFADGATQSGEVSLETLAEKAGCPLP